MDGVRPVADPLAGTRLVVYDEAWRMLRHLAAGPPDAGPVEAVARASGSPTSPSCTGSPTSVPSASSGSEAVALAHGLLADCSTRIVYAQESDQVDATASALGLTDVEAEQLIHLPRGRGLWKVGRHSAIVDHILGAAEYADRRHRRPDARVQRTS